MGHATNINEPQLTSEQIDHLFKFVKSKYVRYIDVQHEIVDHLASSIEVQMKIDGSLSFEKALIQVYSKFPITGFTEIIEEKEKSMRKYWQRKLFFGLSWFLKPELLLIIVSLLILVFYVLSLFGSLAFMILYAAIYGLSLLSIYKNWNKPIFKTIRQENYMFLSTYRGIGAIGGFVFSPAYIPWELFSSIFTLSTIQLYAYSGLIIFIGLYFYAFIFIFPQILREEIDAKYSHLSLNHTAQS